MTFISKTLVAKLAIATTGAIFAVSVVKVEPSKAATFDFTFYPGSGSLSFAASNLTGVGQETANLSNLPGASFALNYIRVLPLGNGGFPLYANFSSSNFSSPTFYFNDGNLVGINSTGSVPVYSFEGRPGYGPASFSGTDTVAIANAQYIETLQGQTTFYDQFTGEVTGTYNPPPFSINNGNILFSTIEPIKPVPEPINTLGAVALGLVAISQRKLFKRQRKQKAKV